MKTKKQKNEHVVFNNYYSSERENQARQNIFDNDIEGAYKSLDDIPDGLVYENMADDERFEFEDFEENFSAHFGKDCALIVSGTFERWNGIRDGGGLCSGIADVFRNCFKNCDYIKITDDNGHLYISGDHHDGHVSVEVRILNYHGRDLYDSLCYVHGREKAVNTCFLNFYSSLPHYCRDIWGTKY